MSRFSFLPIVVLALAACDEPTTSDLGQRISSAAVSEDAHVRTAAFIAVDGVYNSELMAPYDVLHHSIFRDSLDYIRPFFRNTPS